MKKLVYGVLASSIFLSNGIAHEIWIEKDKKNEEYSPQSTLWVAC